MAILCQTPVFVSCQVGQLWYQRGVSLPNEFHTRSHYFDIFQFYIYISPFMLAGGNSPRTKSLCFIDSWNSERQLASQLDEMLGNNLAIVGAAPSQAAADCPI